MLDRLTKHPTGGCLEVAAGAAAVESVRGKDGQDNAVTGQAVSRLGDSTVFTIIMQWGK